MKVQILFYGDWPNRELHSGWSESYGTFESHGHKWHVVQDPANLIGIYSIAHEGTGYTLSGVLKVTPTAAIEAAQQQLQKTTKEQIDAVIRAVKEATGAPLG